MVDRSDRIELASRAHPRGSGVLDLGKRILFPHSRLNGEKYRGAAEVVSENAAPVPTKSGFPRA
jgi:hypothetical protein